MSKENEKMPKNYETATEELESIVEDLQSDHVDIDQLTVKIKRAKLLITYCQNRLRNTEQEVNELFTED